MRIESFSVRRYRSFDKEVTLPISEFTVLTGPNNLGKSNVFRALEVFFGTFERGRYSRLSPQRYFNAEDDPKRYEGRPGRRWTSRFGVSLSFSSEDQRSAKDEMNLSLPDNVDLTLEMKLDDRGVARSSVSSEVISEEELRLFIPWFFQNFRYIYIPAARNIENYRHSMFSELIEGTIGSVGQSSKRVHAIERFFNDVQGQFGSLVSENVLDSISLKTNERSSALLEFYQFLWRTRLLYWKKGGTWVYSMG